MTSAFAQHKLVQKPSKQHRFWLFGVKITQFQSGAPKLACYRKVFYIVELLQISSPISHNVNNVFLAVVSDCYFCLRS